ANLGDRVIAGPDVIRVTTGEEVDFDRLGGGEVHNTLSGVAHFLPQTKDECWNGVRDLLSYLPASNSEQPPVRAASDDPERGDPELQTIVPENPNLPYDMREVVTRVLDDRRFLEVQPFFAQNLVVGLGRLARPPVGVAATPP